jgi:hypothetical protein
MLSGGWLVHRPSVRPSAVVDHSTPPPVASELTIPTVTNLTDRTYVCSIISLQLHSFADATRRAPAHLREYDPAPSPTRPREMTSSHPQVTAADGRRSVLLQSYRLTPMSARVTASRRSHGREQCDRLLGPELRGRHLQRDAAVRSPGLLVTGAGPDTRSGALWAAAMREVNLSWFTAPAGRPQRSALRRRGH